MGGERGGGSGVIGADQGRGANVGPSRVEWGREGVGRSLEYD